MKINALIMDPADNVATCIREINRGETVFYRMGQEIGEIVAGETIPYCHKVALSDLKKGDEIIKYGEVIGRACQDISAGCWVSHENIHGVPRDYADELL